jgi:hypothetical protein
MRSVYMWLLALALLTMPSLAGAHEGHHHTAMGTVARSEKTSLDVKGTDGRVVAFMLDAKTVFQRGEATISLADVKVGERVAVEFADSPNMKMALRVRVDAAKQTTLYVCPMHPEVVSNKPGTCPKCLMNLEPKSKKQ